MLELTEIRQVVETNKAQYLEQLFDFLRIPSVSADSSHKPDMLRAAKFVRDSLQAAGLTACRLYETPGNPVVYAELVVGADKPTVLVYGHYDVQPPDPLALWDTAPFEPVVKNGHIYARGACDDKGQVFMHVKAIEVMQQNGGVPCNVKFMIEGEEEIGSSNLDDFVKSHKDILTCDCVLISDTSMLGNDTPSINTGLRGLSYMEVEVTGPKRDLHSGVYGGAVGNPINILCAMIASLKDKEGRVTIPGFYDAVLRISHDERSEMGRAPFELEAYLKDLDIGAIDGETGYSVPELTSIRPTLDVNGIWGGYTGEGAKTVLPSKASAKISMRLVPDQHSATISALFEAHFKSLAPKSVKVAVKTHHGGEPSVTPVDSPEYRASAMAMEESFGIAPIPQRSGGSIPVVALFQRELRVQSVLLGFGLDSDDIHSPNEHFGLFNFYKGIETIPLFYKYYAAQKINDGVLQVS